MPSHFFFSATVLDVPDLRRIIHLSLKKDVKAAALGDLDLLPLGYRKFKN